MPSLCQEAQPPFGRSMRRYFGFDRNVTNFNHSSFGSIPTPIKDRIRQLQDEVEAHPDAFYTQKRSKLILDSRTSVAKLLNAPVSECVFVRNTTTGISTVLQNIGPLFRKQDVIIYFESTYTTVQNILSVLSGQMGIQTHKVEFPFPITNGELTTKFQKTIHTLRQEGLNPRLAIIDTITGGQGVRFPFEEMVQLCRSEGVQSLIDGAHGIGQIPLNIAELRPDFFITSCHKWLYVPCSCAVLYVPERNQHLIRSTLPPSWGTITPTGQQPLPAMCVAAQVRPLSQFESLFEFVSASDDIASYCIPAALEFRRNICGGEKHIYQYLDQLAREGLGLVAASLNTEVLRGDLDSAHLNGMGAVRLPIAIAYQPGCDHREAPWANLDNSEVHSAIEFIWSFLGTHGMWMPIWGYRDWLWVRLSAQVYLEKADFERLGEILKEACGKIRLGQFKAGRKAVC
ncbi:hypothetical protein FE257_001922 [Aspergillus nanangensis]|uniref:Aminotransferase class V domain-containing protein n=1 Tax=Aspergillus nanangensis TaxID=2582783 RepID=A0AAD4GPA9_ASPNN|nr:hypothetical protein FE257_001922 [Aspergillus nanangensis]